MGEEYVRVPKSQLKGEIIAEVDIRPLKRLAVKLLPESSTFRSIIMWENDSIPTADYVAKLGTWLSILDSEKF